MNLLTRDIVCRKLGLSNWQSYQFFGGNALHLIREDDVLAELNRSRVGIAEAFKFVPDLLTARQMSLLTSVSVDRFKTWIKRTRNPIPHIRLNKHTTRFIRSAAEDWLDANTK